MKKEREKIHYSIYGDSATECLWFLSLNQRLHGANCYNIKYRGQNPEKIEQLIKFSKPDIILCRNKKPILVLEKTSETGTGHNVFQRFDRLHIAASEKIPTIYLCPYDSIKHGKHKGVVRINPRLFQALMGLSKIHSCPSISLKIPVDKNYEIDFRTKDNELKKILDSFLFEIEKGRSYKFVEEIEKMKLENEERCKVRPSYSKPPPTVSIIDTNDLIRNNKIFNENDNFLNRKESILYRIGDKTYKPRTDPFTGTGVAYDYLYARDDKGIKVRNLVARFSQANGEGTYSKDWFLENYPRNNSKLSTWYTIFDALLFYDGLYLCNYSPEMSASEKISSKKFVFNGSNLYGFTEEEEVYLRFKEKMRNEGWNLICGDPPKGTENNPVLEIKPKEVKGSKNSIKPDAFFERENELLIMEFKPYHDDGDQDKLISLLTERRLTAALSAAINEKSNITGQLKYPIEDYSFSCALVNRDNKKPDPRLIHYRMGDDNKFYKGNQNSHLTGKFS